MKRNWTRRDGVLIMAAAVYLFVIDGFVSLYGGHVLVPLLTRPGAQVLAIAGVVLSLAMFLFGLFTLTGRLNRRNARHLG
jgi:uncharacterized membrane protein